MLRPFVLLKDHDRWLGMEIKFGQPYAETLRGDYPRWAQRQDPPNALFMDGNEFWLWTMGSSPILLWRQSSSLVQVLWHRTSNSIFVADEQQVFALNIDEGMSQSPIPLATFDHINDMTTIGRSLYIAGTREGSSGIWELPVE